ncbi:MAG: TM0106 family RecB-like putative nuclease [Corynebacterium sp.]|nr:TM0106 family RecB-like putative nuclease [Corynebacterium sp.]
MFRPRDLVGCKYRLYQSQRYPDTPPTERNLEKEEQNREHREQMQAIAPPAFDAEDDEFRTLEGMAAGEPLILNARFIDLGFDVSLDFLVKRGPLWMPVVISRHHIARPHETRQVWTRNVQTLGHGSRFRTNTYIKHKSPIDGYRLAIAAAILDSYALDSGWGGLISADDTHVYELETSRFRIPEPVIGTRAKRVRECANCRFWQYCEKELQAIDDVSLVVTGDKAEELREQGLDTVQKLINANLPVYSSLARGYRNQLPALRKVDPPAIPRWDVEIDIDMEAYLLQGAYLWGCWDGARYTPFITWEGLGDEGEAKNFAAFWAWLMERREQAHANGQSFAAFCYSELGENYWLRESAIRFEGYPGVPSIDEVNEFIASKEWVDVFVMVRRNIHSFQGLSLKTIARIAGFEWIESDLNGEKSVNSFRIATNPENPIESEKARLLRYNCDDCRATQMVRDWLRAGAPGLHLLH